MLESRRCIEHLREIDLVLRGQSLEFGDLDLATVRILREKRLACLDKRIEHIGFFRKKKKYPVFNFTWDIKELKYLTLHYNTCFFRDYTKLQYLAVLGHGPQPREKYPCRPASS